MKKQTSPGIHLVKHGNQHGSRFFWRLIGKNGRQLARSSETYTRKHNAIKSIDASQEMFGGTNSLIDWTGKKPVTRPITFPIVLFALVLLTACQGQKTKIVILESDSTKLGGPAGFNDTTHFIISNPKMADDTPDTPAVLRPWSGAVNRFDTVPKPDNSTLFEITLPLSDSLVYKGDTGGLRFFKLSDALIDTNYYALGATRDPVHGEWIWPIKSAEVGESNKYGTGILEYYIQFTSKDGTTDILAHAVTTGHTLTFGKEWPRVRQTPRVIKVFGKTYKISD